MSLETKYNLRSPGVKRLMREALELANPTEEYFAAPLEDNLFEWHFTVRGPPETEFEGGFYHGRILLPPQYPMQPPNIILLTPNGRFEINKKICLSISGYHPETWQPSWSIRTALLALIAFMPTKGIGTIGSLDYTPEERQVLAKKSRNWECSICGKIADKLLSAENNASPALTQEESSMLQNIALKAEEDANKKETLGQGNSKSEGEPPDNPEKDTSSSFKPKGRAVAFQEGLDNEFERIDAIPIVQQEDDNVDSIRQRNVAGTSSATIIGSEITDEILRASIERSKKDKFWAMIIYLILAIIAILLIRRIFFL